jgi:hypothetical protein
MYGIATAMPSISFIGNQHQICCQFLREDRSDKKPHWRKALKHVTS